MSDQKWLQLVCFTHQKHHEDIEAEMEAANALSITWQDAADDPVLEPLPGETPLWEHLIITALFDFETDLSELSNLLRVNKKNWQIESFLIETIIDQDWERVWMKNFHPMQFGENLWVYPSNHKIPKDQSVKILLDPGLAFGSGTHPTTALCLEWLDKNPPKDNRVIDYGCGSGILALASVKLGANDVLATDIDPQALIATKDNMQRNDIDEEFIDCYLSEELNSDDHSPFDLVLANILCGPLLKLFPHLSALTRPSGKLVISGLLSEQSDDLINTYSKSFKDFDIQEKEGWVRISATRKENN